MSSRLCSQAACFSESDGFLRAVFLRRVAQCLSEPWSCPSVSCGEQSRPRAAPAGSVTCFCQDAVALPLRNVSPQSFHILQLLPLQAVAPVTELLLLLMGSRTAGCACSVGTGRIQLGRVGRSRQGLPISHACSALLNKPRTRAPSGLALQGSRVQVRVA